MLKRLNDLEEKLDTLLKKLVRMHDEVEARDREIARLRKTAQGASGAGQPAESAPPGDCVPAAQLEKAEQENAKLRDQVEKLEKELENRVALEKETLGKLMNILTRIDALEAEIGELQNE